MKIWVLILVLLSTPSCYRQSDIASKKFSLEEKKFSPEELKQDIGYLFERLEAIHPSLYHYTSKEQAAAARTAVEQELTQPMTRVEFARKVIPLVAMLKDGHTSLSFPQSEQENFFSQGGTVFPFAVMIRQNQLLVTENHSVDRTIEPLTEILSINGTPTRAVLDNLRRYISAEKDEYRDVRIERDFGALFRYVYGFDQEYEFELSFNGDISRKKISGLIQREIRDDLIKSGALLFPPNYSYRKLATDVGILDFRSMVDQKEFQIFLKSTFAEIKRDQIKHLIIDLRNNGGGFSRVGDALFDYITSKPYRQGEQEEIKTSPEMKLALQQAYGNKWYIKLAYPVALFHPAGRAYFFKKSGSMTTWKSEGLRTPKNVANKFTGKTYLLTSRYTYSAANMFSAAYKCYGMGTVIGEETGQALTNFGDLVSIFLPNTKLSAGCSHKKFVLACASGGACDVVPDIEIIPTLEDIRNGRDAAVEHILQLVPAK